MAKYKIEFCILVTALSTSVGAEWLRENNATYSEIKLEGSGTLGDFPCTTNITDTDNLLTRNGIISIKKRWRNLSVFIDPAYNTAQRMLITQTLNTYKKVLPCVAVQIYPRDTIPVGDYVHIVNKEGCWSFVGRRGGRQELSLAMGGCVTRRAILHEFGHVLGLGHEHQRVDRDEHINIHWENIRGDKRKNFRKLNGAYYSDFGVSYNIRSIMHYSAWGFGNGWGPSMTTKDGVIFESSDQLASTDIRKLRNMYNC